MFRLVARNDGDAPGPASRSATPCPAGLTPVAADAGCTIAGQEVVCLIDELGSGDQQAFEVRARAEPAAAGKTLTNRGTVTALAADPEPADDASEAAVTIGALPATPSAPAGQGAAPRTDLALRVIAPTGTHRVGDSTRWTIEVTNVSQETATNVGLTGVAGGSARGNTARVSQSGCGPQPPAGCALGTLAPGERRTAIVRLTPVRPGPLTLSGTVTAAQAESRTDNNDDRATDPHRGSAHHGESRRVGTPRSGARRHVAPHRGHGSQPWHAPRARLPCLPPAATRSRRRSARRSDAPRPTGVLEDRPAGAGSPPHAADDGTGELRARPAHGPDDRSRRQRAPAHGASPATDRLRGAASALHRLIPAEERGLAPPLVSATMYQ